MKGVERERREMEGNNREMVRQSVDSGLWREDRKVTGWQGGEERK
jgi:hypothetical protein